MKKTRLAAALAALLVALGLSIGPAVMPTAAPADAPQLVQDAVDVVAPQAAEAGALCDTLRICGDLIHSTPDYGYNAPITATCNLGDPWSQVRYVYEGQTANCHDTDGFWVNYGTTITCTWHGDGYGSATFRYTGQWIKIYDNQNWRCVVGVA